MMAQEGFQDLINQILWRLEQIEASKEHFFATWVQAESVDSDLSIIDVGEPNEIYNTSQIRFIPKISGVSPSAGQTVICLRNPVIILGVIVGDVTLAEV
jgi:hypothetical protein